MTTEPSKPWRATRSWTELRGKPPIPYTFATPHSWPTELEARAGAERLARADDLPHGAHGVAVDLERWDGFRWALAGTYEAPAETADLTP